MSEQLLMFQELSDQSAFQEGYEKARAEMKEQLRLLESMSKSVMEEKKQLLEKMRPEVILFCVELTEQLLRQELKNPDVFAKMIDSLLMAVGRQKRTLSIHLAPEDIAMMKALLSQMEKTRGPIHFVSDPMMTRGDVRIEGDDLLVNCNLQRELESLCQHVLRGG